VAMAHGGSLDGLREDRDTLANVDAFGAPLPTARFRGGREWAAICAEHGAEQAARRSAARADECLGWIGARGDLIVEGRFSKNDAFCRELSALRPAQPVVRSADETGTLGGALALWRYASSEVISAPRSPPG